MGKVTFSMPPGQKFLGGLGVPVLLVLFGLAQGGYLGGDQHTPIALITAVVIAVAVMIVLFGRRTVLTPQGIAYGYFFFVGQPIPWIRINKITASSKTPLKASRVSWQVILYLDGGGAIKLPVPYAVGKDPSAAFSAEYEAIHQCWHQEKAHAKSLARRSNGQKHSA